MSGTGYPLFIPLLRDSFRAEESFSEWKHQAFIPFVGGSILEFILKDLAYSAKNAKTKLDIQMVIRESELGKAQKIRKNLEIVFRDMGIDSVNMNFQSGTHYRYLRDIVRIIERAIGDYNEENNDSNVYIVHYPSIVLQNEVYKKFLESLELLKETSNPSILLVVFPESLGRENRDVQVLKDDDKVSIKDIIPRSDIKLMEAGDIKVRRGTKLDYVIFKDKNKTKIVARMLGVFALNHAFYEELVKSGNINLTSENRFQDVLKYLCATHGVKVNIVKISGGMFASLKYPWQILKAFDFVGRFLLYRLFSGNDVDYVKLILNSKTEKPWKPLLIKERYTGQIKVQELKLEDMKEKKALEPPTYGYAFEDYPLRETLDSIEKYFLEKGYSAVALIRTQEEAEEAFNRIVEDMNTVLIRGVVFIEDRSDKNKETKISAGAQVRTSYLGGGTKVLGQAILDHSIVGENVVVYPNAVVPYAILGNNVVIAGQVTLAREKARPVLSEDIKPPAFYTGREIIRFKDRFSAIVGDNTKIMIGVDISPGCRIGHDCEIFPNLSIKYNVPPNTRIRYEGVFEKRGIKEKSRENRGGVGP